MNVSENIVYLNKIIDVCMISSSLQHKIKTKNANDVFRKMVRLSGVYTGEKTIYVFAIASSGVLKKWENFY